MPGCPVCHSDSSWRLGKVGCIRSTAWRATYDLHLQRIHSERQLSHDDHDNEVQHATANASHMIPVSEALACTAYRAHVTSSANMTNFMVELRILTAMALISKSSAGQIVYV